MIIRGDCIEEMKKLPDNSVDAIITDPPYELGFMGKHGDASGIANNISMWKEAFRVLKPGGHLLSFGGTRTYHRMACAIEDAGFEIRDMIEWVYGSGFPKSLNIGKAVDMLQGNKREVVGKIAQPGSTNKRIAMGNGWQEEPDLTKGNSPYEGYGTALKPSHEPIVMARKPLSKKTVAENVLKWGTGGINIDESRVETSDNLNGGIYSKGEWVENPNEIFGARKKVPNGYIQPTGRFPANLIHDGSEEVVGMFPQTNNNGKISFNPEWKESNNQSQIKLGGGQHNCNYTDKGTAARFFKTCEFTEGDFDYPPFFYTAKASKSERNEGCDEIESKYMDESRSIGSVGGSNPRNRGAETPRKNHHPTVKPIKLMEYLIKLVAPPNGTILDPFFGSGTTGVAATKLGFKFIGIEKEEEYVKIAEARIKPHLQQEKLI